MDGLGPDARDARGLALTDETIAMLSKRIGNLKIIVMLYRTQFLQ